MTCSENYDVQTYSFPGDNANAPYGQTTYSESTQHPAYVYFPSGTYLVTETLPVVYYTQMVGDPANIPTIKFVSNQEVRVLEVAGIIISAIEYLRARSSLRE